MGRESEEISFHFHLDRALIEQFGTFHLHLHVNGQAARAASTPAPATLSTAPAMLSSSAPLQLQKSSPVDGFLGDLEICWPQSTDRVDAFQNQICAIINARSSVTLERPEVRAKIYNGASCGLSATPATPPDSATVGKYVGIGKIPGFEPCNVAFLAQFNNLIPGADVSGAQNCLVVWARFTASSDWRKTTILFTARAADSTDCPSVNPSIIPMAAMRQLPGRETPVAEWPVPRQYRLSIDSASLEQARGTRIESTLAALARQAEIGPIVLNYDGEQSAAAAPEWRKICRRRGEWRLRVTRLKDSCTAVLTCSALDGATLPAALIWKSRNWTPEAAFRIQPASPSDLASILPGCILEPT